MRQKLKLIFYVEYGLDVILESMYDSSEIVGIDEEDYNPLVTNYGFVPNKLGETSVYSGFVVYHNESTIEDICEAIYNLNGYQFGKVINNDSIMLKTNNQNLSLYDYTDEDYLLIHLNTALSTTENGEPILQEYMDIIKQQIIDIFKYYSDKKNIDEQLCNEVLALDIPFYDKKQLTLF